MRRGDCVFTVAAMAVIGAVLMMAACGSPADDIVYRATLLSPSDPGKVVAQWVAEDEPSVRNGNAKWTGADGKIVYVSGTFVIQEMDRPSNVAVQPASQPVAPTPVQPSE